MTGRGGGHDGAAGAPPAAGTPVVTVLLLALAAAYAGWASGATAFTVAADVFVSVPSAVFAAALVLQRRRPATGAWRRMDPAAPHDGAGALPWLVAVALLLAMELASYFHGGPRADYPTISSGLNGLFRYRPAKAAVWFLWLTVGWFMCRR